MSIPRYLTTSFFAFFVFLLPGSSLAHNHYSYELTEKLTSLIEWRDYGPDAFNEAIAKNKPIFLLLTAPSWCYWCQVYESDEYLFDEQIYPYINKNFIPVYVDADKRQDLTRHYLEGGWPSTTLMAPNRERIYGFSGPQPVPTLLENMGRAVAYVDQGGFATVARGTDYKPASPRIPSETELKRQRDAYAEYNASLFDPTFGGFGQNRKFPQPRTLMAFLDRFEETKESVWSEMIEKTLENQYTKLAEMQTNYNLYDPIEGGFHRYGTTRNWTPPHYEKMLYDNSRLLQLYARLADVTGNPLAKEVSDKTFLFLQTWYDAKKGGFAGNSDAFNEERYYGEVERAEEKPRVERTKYTDWNSDAIIAFFDIGKRRNDEEALDMAEKTLTFFLTQMVDEHGPFHFMSLDGTKGVQGNLPDSATLLIASVEGYRAAENPLFLSGAVRIADYALENLYDWNGGGFFERNSHDADLYAPDELLLVEKPPEENGMMAYGLLLLWEQTNDIRYLTAAVRTMGQFSRNVPSLDTGYFLYRSAKEALRLNALEAFTGNQEAVTAVEDTGKQSFFLTTEKHKEKTSTTRKQFVPVDSPDTLTGPVFLLFLIAFIAGLLSFLSPCTLPILPAYMAAVLKTDRRHQVFMALSFLSGLALLFSLFGMSASFIGTLLREYLTIFTQVAGALVVLFGLMILSGRGFHGLTIVKEKPTTCISAFLFGGTIGISWTPCVGPILIAILAIASTLNSAIKGGALLFSYALGLGLPLVLFSSVLQKLPKEGRVWKFLRGKEYSLCIGKKTVALHSTSLISGLLFVLLGILIFSGTLYTFNQYIAATGIQKWFFSIEEWILKAL